MTRLARLPATVPAAAVLAALLAGPVAAITTDRLATLVGDRVPGAPVDCIEAAEVDQVHIVRAEGAVPAALAYVMRTGGEIYLNRPATGTTFLHDGVSLAVDQNGTQLCRATLVRVLNENSRRPIAAIELGPFVPYRRR